jgi:1-phosphatidylinositol-4-phosphate 5-kinase
MYSVEMDDQKTKSRGIIDEVKEKLMPHKSDERVFVIMNSVFPAEGSKFISERYDLKGSTVGRECSEEEKQRKGSNAVLKDLDLAKEVELVRSLERPRMRSSYGINIGPVAKSSLLSQLRKDVKLLMECNVMDYSLLVGVVDMDSGNLDAASLKAFEKSELYESRMRQLTRKKQSMGRVILSSITTPLRILVAPATFFARQMWEKAETTLSTILTLPLPYYGAGICGIDGGSLSKLKGTRNGKRAMYYIGVIDFLQPWTASKVVERQLKGFMGYDTRAISCVTPEEYAARFLVFMDSHVS